MRVLFVAAMVSACLAACARPYPGAAIWNPEGAAAYLDARADWWVRWRDAARDRDTFCMSCHTTLPYALTRRDTVPARAILEDVRERVRRWNDVSPYYGAHDRQSAKATESRATEAVLNALILATADARTGHLSDETRLAFDDMWALQRNDGPGGGAWPWLQFHLEPWEGEHGEYYGATLAALAIGTAPDHYATAPAIRPRLDRLRAYLERELAAQPLSNRAALLWASAAVPGLLSGDCRAAIAADLRDAQQRDGGWSLQRLDAPVRWWDPRRLAWPGDGYATGLTVLALRAVSRDDDAAVARGREWLAAHQSAADGSWPGHSLNGLEPASPDIARFMTDAATAYAVLALTAAPQVR